MILDDTRSLVQADRNNWNPRVGIAYRPFADTRTVVRAGYGVYTHMFPGLLAFRGTGGPWQTDYSLSLIGDRPTMRFPNPFQFAGRPEFGGVTNSCRDWLARRRRLWRRQPPETVSRDDGVHRLFRPLGR